jgi:hypothetical protein
VNTSQVTTPAVDGKIRRPPIREILQDRITRLEERRFRNWLDKTGYFVANRQVAKTMLSTYIEQFAKVLNGVWFTEPKKVSIGVTRETVLKMNVPDWMTAFILSYDDAPWASK